jgi:hypothetical protein
VKVKLWLPTDEECDQFRADNFWYDHTRISAIHTCPQWGIVRYMYDKTLGDVETRAMPLEAGGACHEAFAAHRLWLLSRAEGTLDVTGNPIPKGYTHTQGVRIFGEQRWDNLWEHLGADDNGQSILLQAFYTSGFEDSPDDKRRTVSNIEQSLLHYLQRYDPTYPIYVRDEFCGIEVPIRMGVEFEDGRRLCYIGRADAVLRDGERPFLVENKTGSNVSNSWERQWETSHQVTGYMLGLSLRLGDRVDHGAVIGLQIPLPRTSEYKGYNFTHVTRNDRQFSTFFQWLSEGDLLWRKFKDDPFNATKYTHSCYRYFRPCTFIPVCAGDEEFTLDEMTDAPWHPTAE